MIDINTPECRALVVYQRHLSVKDMIFIKNHAQKMHKIVSDTVRPTLETLYKQTSIIDSLSSYSFLSQIKKGLFAYNFNIGPFLDVNTLSKQMFGSSLLGANTEMQLSGTFKNVFQAIEDSQKLSAQIISQYMPVFEKVESLFGNNFQWWVDENNRISKLVESAFKFSSFNFEVWSRFTDEEKTIEQGFKVKVSKDTQKPLNLEDFEIQPTEKIIELKGVKYRVLLTPENNPQINFNKANIVEGYLTEKENLSLALKVNEKMKCKNKKRKGRLIYNERERRINIGSYHFEIQLTKSFDFINHCLIIFNKEDKVNRWAYKDLLDSFDPAERVKAGAFDRCKRRFNLLKNRLPKEIQDVFKVTNKYIEINPKYRWS